VNNCNCCSSTNIFKKFNSSYFDSEVIKCKDCGYAYTKNTEKYKLEKLYHNKDWKEFSNISKIEHKIKKRKLKKIWEYLIKHSGANKNSARSLYVYLKPFFNNKTLLDVGADKGYVLEIFEKKGFKVFGIEPSLENVQYINSKLKKNVCKVGFLEEINFDYKKFDLIIASHVLEHIQDIKLGLTILKNILSNDGILFIAVPNCFNEEVLVSSVYKNPHIHHFTKKSLEKIFSELNFEIISNEIYSMPKLISKIDYLKYLLEPIMKKQMGNIDSEKNGSEIRIIIKQKN